MLLRVEYYAKSAGLNGCGSYVSYIASSRDQPHPFGSAQWLTHEAYYHTSWAEMVWEAVCNISGPDLLVDACSLRFNEDSGENSATRLFNDPGYHI